MSALERRTFTTPRDSGYARAETLEKLAGQPRGEFGHVVLKELLDDALDAAEIAGVTPGITVTVTPSGDRKLLTVEDNAGGIAPETVTALCDFTKAVSDKAAYAGPTRGTQGNAYPLILSIPHALGVRPPTVIIEAQRVRHEITPAMILGQRLKIGHVTQPCGRATGTRVTVPLPADLPLDARRWAEDCATVNSHANIFGGGTRRRARNLQIRTHGGPRCQEAVVN